jgi:hypothetical protein
VTGLEPIPTLANSSRQWDSAGLDFRNDFR